MIQKINNYFSNNKKLIYKKAFILALFLVAAAIFYANFKLAQTLIFTAMENEKKSHVQKVCETMDKIDNRADFFLSKIGVMRNRNVYLSKNQKKELIRELRTIEGDIRSEELSYFEFYGNDLSVKLFSKHNGAEINNLFSQMINLPIYGYRAVESMEDLLKSNYPSIGQLDISEIEFSVLKERIVSIRNKTAICQ